jgi:AraC-like DNA-binding protein
VSCYFSAEHRGPARTVRTFADGCVDLVFDLCTARAMVSGAASRGAEYTVSGPHHLFGARFVPGGAHALLRVSAADLGSGWQSLEPPLAAAGRELGERMAVLPDVSSRIALLEQFLLKRIAGVPIDGRVTRATHLLVGTHGTLAIPALALEVGASERNLGRLFQQWVGLRPKQLARIIRFQAVVRRARLEPRPDWAALAAELGYADQAHLVREFGAFAAISPTAHLASLAEFFNTSLGTISKLSATKP